MTLTRSLQTPYNANKAIQISNFLTTSWHRNSRPQSGRNKLGVGETGKLVRPSKVEKIPFLLRAEELNDSPGSVEHLGSLSGKKYSLQISKHQKLSMTQGGCLVCFPHY